MWIPISKIRHNLWKLAQCRDSNSGPLDLEYSALPPGPRNPPDSLNKNIDSYDIKNALGLLFGYFFLIVLFTFQVLSSGCALFPCTQPGCGAVLKTKWSHSQHMKRHLGIYLYHCPYCNKGLSGTTNVKEHLKAQHTGLLGFHCVKCQQEFKSVHELRDHLEQQNCSG